MLGQRESADARVKELARLLFERLDPSLLGVGAHRVSEFLAHVGSSAPRLTGPDGRPLPRWQDQLIEQEISPKATVLDLGCGNGELLARLIQVKHVRGQGVELDGQAVAECVAHGVPVFQADLDEGLKGFPDRSFDYVILEETLQTLHRPIEVLREVVRAGRRGIVSFPNFGYWRVRLDLGLRGRMPRTEWLPHHWYDTPNIHLLTLQDFLDWAEKEQVAIEKGHVLVEGRIRPLEPADNLYAEEALLVVRKR